MKTRYESVACGGMDVHYKSSQVTFRDARGAVVTRERLDHTDRAAMRKQVGRWPKGIPMVLEASFGWGWVSDEVEALGLVPQLSDCYKVEQMRKARGSVKTNKKDADLLSMLPAEATAWWQVWRAPAPVRDRREWMRFRADLVKVQTETAGRIHSVFHRHGIFFTGGTDLFGGVGRQFLAELCRDGRHAGGVLPEGALSALRSQVALIMHLRASLSEAAKRLKVMLSRDPLTKRLDGIPGFGLILSHTVQSEIGEIGRFRSHRALASYACLAPRADETGEADPTRAPLGRHLGDRGNRTLKWAFIEAAHGAVRHGGRWRAMFDRATDGGKKNRGRGYIQVARELVTMVYIVWSRNVTYMESPAARPGTRSVRSASPVLPRGKAKKHSRPGTGQPLHPMVQA